MATKKSSNAQVSRRIYAAKVRKLQKAGLLKGVNPDKKPTPAVHGVFRKYQDLLTGRAAAVQAPTGEKARELRKRLGVRGSGKTLIIPREKGERITVTKAGIVKSHREAYGQTIDKEIGAKIAPPAPGEKIYYTIPRRKRGLGMLKRHTFASFDEMLFYLEKYEVDFEDIEDYIETEKFREGSRKGKRLRKEYEKDRLASYKRAKRRERQRRKSRR